ncbi:MAG TPA: hypothetical protein VFP44_04780 [Usitatibacter sp.]|nr:hypothetical protein [Usitatibacter sp.]
MGLITRILLLVASLAALPAAASFHLWTMTELYSNADGSVQFLEMRALTGSEQFFAGHTLTSSAGGVTHTFTVPTDLPGDSSGRRMIFGTQGFAALGVVRPDYVVPNGFFFPGGGTVNWADADVWNHPALPVNGDDSLNRDGSTGPNSPQNFAGQTGHVSATPVISPALNIEGLWWASPPGSESGWGLNITQQGDIIFATWFTYDANGPMWLVMSQGERQAGTNAYEGALFRTTGPAFSAVPFDPSRVSLTPVGSARLTFTDASNGSFAYTVNGVQQAKAITRQVFASPVPACTEGGSQGSAPNFQDLWWRAPAGSESGWGVNIQHQGDILFVTWFTYDASGKGMWLVGSDIARTGPNTFTGSLFTTTGPAFNASPWNPSQVVVTPAGTATFTFSDANNGTFAYTVNGVSQAKPITRQLFSSPPSVCR